MFQPQDSIHHSAHPIEEAQPTEIQSESSSAVGQMTPAKPRHPYQVLRQLPADATPAQQDSAIQAVFHPDTSHFSTRPDTLYIPGYGKGKSYKDSLSLPQYYKESFFANDSLLHPEVPGGRYGVAGDPVPYAMRSDDVVTGLLVMCFLLAVISIARSRHFIYRQAKNFFYVSHGNRDTEETETGSEVRFQLFLVVLTCLLMSLLCFFYATNNVSSTFVLRSQYELIALFFASFIGYFLVKILLYCLLNIVFFDSKKNEQMARALLFVWAGVGLVLFPLVLLQGYFEISIRSVALYATVLLVLVKILLFYKAYLIFFRQKGLFLHFILYFCALEIVPALALAGFLTQIVGNLKINF